mgnify:CR=1 FL=1
MKRTIVATTALAAIAAAASVAWLLTWRAPERSAPLTLAVREGESVREIARDLAGAGAIPSQAAFVLLARWTKLVRDAGIKAE